jgi:hypothetical protein
MPGPFSFFEASGWRMWRDAGRWGWDRTEINLRPPADSSITDGMSIDLGFSRRPAWGKMRGSELNPSIALVSPLIHSFQDCSHPSYRWRDEIGYAEGSLAKASDQNPERCCGSGATTPAAMRKVFCMLLVLLGDRVTERVYREGPANLPTPPFYGVSTWSTMRASRTSLRLRPQPRRFLKRPN